MGNLPKDGCKCYICSTMIFDINKPFERMDKKPITIVDRGEDRIYLQSTSDPIDGSYYVDTINGKCCTNLDCPFSLINIPENKIESNNEAQENINWLKEQTEGKPISAEQLKKINSSLVEIRDELVFPTIRKLDDLILLNVKIIKECFNKEDE